MFDSAAHQAGDAAGPSSRIAAGLQNSAAAILSSAIAVTSKAGIPLEAYPSAHALKTTGGACQLSLYATTPKLLPAKSVFVETAPEKRPNLKAVNVNGVLKCEGVICCSEPATAALGAACAFAAVLSVLVKKIV